jgi:hypothetical protein
MPMALLLVWCAFVMLVCVITQIRLSSFIDYVLNDREAGQVFARASDLYFVWAFPQLRYGFAVAIVKTPVPPARVLARFPDYAGKRRLVMFCLGCHMLLGVLVLSGFVLHRLSG